AGAGFGGFGDFADIFGQFFGRGGAGTRTGGRTADPGMRRGRDIETEVRLSFEQAMNGVKVPVVVDKRDTCETCGGSGAKPGTSPSLCPECRGRGVIGRDAGGFSIGQPCPRCAGNGTVIEDPCPTCSGAGSISARRRYQVTVPPGAKDGTVIRLKGKGEAGARGGTPGDLLVTTRVAPSRVFTRRGDDLVVDVPVTFPEAALGAQVEVPTLNGRVKLRVPAGSADGRSLRVPGQGAPKLKGGGRGDLIATLRLAVPETLTDAQREALEAYAAADASDPRAGLF
ncbi:MAG TPA: J domain-containing protein, partial [Miltoncostaeaceae bacterium]|nr:J domain-containing protein [Miltoncostaeaceae bacterium]